MVGCLLVGGGRVVGEGWHSGPAGRTPRPPLWPRPGARGGRDGVRHARALLPPRPHAALRGRPRGRPRRAGGGRRRRPDAEGRRPGDGPPPPGRRDGRAARCRRPARAAGPTPDGGLPTHALLGRPHVTYKAAATLDGRTAARGGDSQWISSPESRALVHEWRARAGAVLVGAGTALHDDPTLTARDVAPPATRQPLRVVWDRRARLEPTSRLARTAGDGPVLVLVGPEAASGRRSGAGGGGRRDAGGVRRRLGSAGAGRARRHERPLRGRCHARRRAPRRGRARPGGAVRGTRAAGRRAGRPRS